ncbi:MAG: FmdB family transcriptional regulator [Actinomycetota bacterium]|nr:FmdB family transcriptional regulator [Actinomycetota bacterium]
MPTYVYKFVKTGETIEVQQSFDDDALTQAVHPRSGRRMAVKKVFTPVGVTFKGGGFYKTDSRGKSSSKTPSTATSTTESKNGDSGKTGDSGSSSTSSSTESASTTPTKKSDTSSSSSSTSTP